MNRIVVIAVLVGACAAPVLAHRGLPSGLADGAYTESYSHWPNSARVRVTINDGRIASVEVLHHGASPIGARAVPAVPQRIVSAQSAQVDAVSGATNSSRVIMNATQKAIDSAVAAASARR